MDSLRLVRSEDGPVGVQVEPREAYTLKHSEQPQNGSKAVPACLSHPASLSNQSNRHAHGAPPPNCIWTHMELQTGALQGISWNCVKCYLVVASRVSRDN